MEKTKMKRASQWFIGLALFVITFGLIVELLRTFGYRELYNKLNWNPGYTILYFALMSIGVALDWLARKQKREENRNHFNHFTED